MAKESTKRVEKQVFTVVEGENCQQFKPSSPLQSTRDTFEIDADDMKLGQILVIEVREPA